MKAEQLMTRERLNAIKLSPRGWFEVDPQRDDPELSQMEKDRRDLATALKIAVDALEQIADNTVERDLYGHPNTAQVALDDIGIEVGV